MNSGSLQLQRIYAIFVCSFITYALRSDCFFFSVDSLGVFSLVAFSVKTLEVLIKI